MSAQFQVGTWKQHMTTIASTELLLLFQEARAGTRVVLDCRVWLPFHSSEASLWRLKPEICTAAPFFRFDILRLRPSTIHRTLSAVFPCLGQRLQVGLWSWWYRFHWFHSRLGPSLCPMLRRYRSHLHQVLHEMPHTCYLRWLAPVPQQTRAHSWRYGLELFFYF